MTVVFIAWGASEGYEAVVRQARDFAPKVRVLSDPPCAMLEALQPADLGRRSGVARWFVLRDFIRRERPGFPVFLLDWDMVLFHDLAEAYEPFREHDFCVTRGSSAYGLNRIEPLEQFCDLTESLLRNYAGTAGRYHWWRREHPFFNEHARVEDGLGGTAFHDMFGWGMVRKSFYTADLSNPANTPEYSVFDDNVLNATGYRRAEDGSKHLTWGAPGGGRRPPYFTDSNGWLVRANWIHCAGPDKSRIQKLIASHA